MKKVFLPLLLASAILVFGCHSNNGQKAGQTPENDSATKTVAVTGSNTEHPASIARNQEALATVELCTCVNSFLAEMSPQVREIIVKAGKSRTPMQTLTAELQQVKGAAEQERLFREFEKFENDQQLQRCSESIKLKYNLNENDTASRAKVLKAAEENRECEVVYALMKIGLEQEKMAGAGKK